MRIARLKITLVVLVLLSAAITVTLPFRHRAGAAPAAATIKAVGGYPVPLSGVWTVVGHGNGHGHGLSQYGSYGRALAGQTAAQIVSFYYPGTALQPLSAAVAVQPVRVLLSNAGNYTTVAAAAGLTFTGVTGSPSVVDTDAFRLIPAAPGLSLQAHHSGVWQTVQTGLPASVTISSPSAMLSLITVDGSPKVYAGTLTAAVAGAATQTINTVGLDEYVRGVVPNESPASWPAAALQAQAIAARSYAAFEIRDHAGAAGYDLCDTSACQVYRGMSSEVTASNAAVTATAGQLLTYLGLPIFAQFTSSDAGWTIDGGKPYLPAQQDLFDTAEIDPWFNWTRSVPASQVATFYSLTEVTSLRVIGRTGHGDFGGAATAVAIDGVRAGVATTITATGASIREAMNLPLEWFEITNTGPPTAPVVTALPTSGAVTVNWQAPSTVLSGAFSAYTVTLTSSGATIRQVFAPTVRTAHFDGLTNGVSYRVLVRAVTVDAGEGAAGVVVAIPTVAKPGAPAVPTGVSTWPGNQASYVYWSPVPVPGVTGYSITVLGVARYVRPGNTSTDLFPGLLNGHAYTMYVRAINAVGESDAVAVEVIPAPVAAPPTKVVIAPGVRSVTVAWQPPLPVVGLPITGYSATVIGVIRSDVALAVHGARFGGLVSGTRYRLYLRTSTAAGAGPAYMAAFVAK